MKNFTKIILSLLLLFALTFSLTACGKDEEKPVIELTGETATVEKFEQINILKSTANIANIEEIEWKSLDESICTVNKGVVEAISEGKAQVTASYKKVEASCEVEVTKTNKRPTLLLDKNNITIRPGMEIPVNGTLTYKNKVRSTTFTYTSSNQSVATVDANGIIKAVGVGSTDVMVTAKFGDISVSAITKVNVIKDVDISVGLYDVDLYLNQSVNPGGNVHQISPKTLFNQQEYATTYTYESSDTKIATVDANGLVTVKKAGSAVITIKATVDGKEYAEKINVNANKSVSDVDYSGVFEVYSGMNGTALASNKVVFKANDLQLTATEMASREMYYTANGETVKVKASFSKLSEGNTVCTFDAKQFGGKVYGEGVVLTLETDTLIYNTHFEKIITKILSTKEDLDNLLIYGGVSKGSDDLSYDGYFVMGDNIDCGNTLIQNRTADYIIGHLNAVIKTDGGFEGIFDGQGYVIYNVPAFPAQQSLFGLVEPSGVIKNLGYKGKVNTVGGWGQLSTTISGNFNGTMENCYFDITATSDGTPIVCGPIVFNAISAKFKDVAVKYDASKIVSFRNEAFAWDNKSSTMDNVSIFIKKGDGAADGDVFKAYVHSYDESTKYKTADEKYWVLGYDQPFFKQFTNLFNEIPSRSVEYVGETYQEVPFEVYGEDTETFNKFTVDLGDDFVSVEDIGVEINGNSVDEYTLAEGVLTIDGSKFGSSVYGDVNVSVITAEMAYRIKSFKVITKVIKTFDDLDNLMIYGGLKSDKSYNGYFVLGNNIDCNAKTFAHRVPGTDITALTSSGAKTSGGFKGMFDGKGFSIINVPSFATGASLFGVIEKIATVKNLGYTGTVDCLASPGITTTLAGSLNGTLENCYFDIKSVGDGKVLLVAPVVYYTNSAVIKDIVVKYDASSITKFRNEPFAVKDTSSTIVDDNLVILMKKGNTKDDATVFKAYCKDYDAKCVFQSASDDSYWGTVTIAENITQPIFKSLIPAPVE